MIITDARRARGIVWIASYPKSGNTWVRMFLHHMMRIARGVAPDENELARLHESTRAEGSHKSLFEKFLGKPVKDADWREIVAIRPKVQAAIAESSGGVTMIKTHSVMGRILDVPTINLAASAGAIYIVRNPLDIALSLAPGAGITVDEAIALMETPSFRMWNAEHTIFEVLGSWSENVESWTGEKQDPVLVVRYEDVLADAVASFSAVAAHLRRRPTAEDIGLAVSRASFETARAQEEKFGFAERPRHTTRFFRLGRAGQWREALSAAQVERVVATHGAQMRRFGYWPAP